MKVEKEIIDFTHSSPITITDDRGVEYDYSEYYTKLGRKGRPPKKEEAELKREMKISMGKSKEDSKRAKNLTNYLDKREICYYKEQVMIELIPQNFYLKTYYSNVTYLPKLYFGFLGWEIFLNYGGTYDPFELIKRKLLFHKIKREVLIPGKIIDGGPIFSFKSNRMIVGDCNRVEWLEKMLDYFEAHPGIDRHQILFSEIFYEQHQDTVDN